MVSGVIHVIIPSLTELFSNLGYLYFINMKNDYILCHVRLIQRKLILRTRNFGRCPEKHVVSLIKVISY